MEKSSSEERNAAIFRTRRVLLYPRQQIFAAFSNPEVLAQWWGPDGFTNTFEIFEFKPGGRWKFVMHGPDGANHANESVFLTIKPPSAIVIQHISPPHFVLTIKLTAHDSGTRIDWVGEFEDAAVAARIRHIVEPANEQNLDRLEAIMSRDKLAAS
jgi:uncharacterized protein YndB with AHSA1/START domain